MIKVKFFGMMRLNLGIDSMEVDAENLKQAIDKIAAEGKAGKKELKNCVIMVNGTQAKINTKLKDGDEIVFLSPAGGG